MVLDVYMILGSKYFHLLLGYEPTKSEPDKSSDSEDNEEEPFDDTAKNGAKSLIVEIENWWQPFWKTCQAHLSSIT